MVGWTKRIDRYVPGFKNRKRRWIQRRQLRRSGIVVISQAKSGRTWLNAMLSHIMHQLHGLDRDLLIGNRSTERFCPGMPKVLFTHDNAAKWGKPLATLAEYRGKRVVLLVRDPRDSAVSLYFQRQRAVVDPASRAKPHAQPMFARVSEVNLPRHITFLERWAGDLDALECAFLLRYEDLRSQPVEWLSRLLAFLEIEASDEMVGRAVDFAAFGKLRSKEASGAFRSDKLRNFDPRNPDAFKVRRGKVGGYRDYFTAGEIEVLDCMVEQAGLGRFGYGVPAAEETLIPRAG